MPKTTTPRPPSRERKLAPAMASRLTKQLCDEYGLKPAKGKSMFICIEQNEVTVLPARDAKIDGHLRRLTKHLSKALRAGDTDLADSIERTMLLLLGPKDQPFDRPL